VLQRVAAFCSVLQRVAACCNMLQRVAACMYICTNMEEGDDVNTVSGFGCSYNCSHKREEGGVCVYICVYICIKMLQMYLFI